MSASQLLRILQSLPTGSEEEICDFNDDELEESTNANKCATTNPFLSNEEDNQVNFWNNMPELEGSTFRNEFNNNHEDAPYRQSAAFAKTTGLRIDKHLVECELPELIVCYKDKERDFHVKDICIDEGIPDEFRDNSGLVNGDDDGEASVDTEFVNNGWFRSSKMACCNMDGEFWSTNTDQLASKVYDDDINQHPLQGSKDKLGKRAIVGCAAQKQDKDFQLKNVYKESKIEEGVTNFHCDTRKVEDSNPCGAMNPESLYELPLKTENVVNQQDTGSSYKVAVKNHETRYDEGESSFSMAGVISELISCSRPMPFSGGISTRSDSSATSTRSFAFPTLQTEYASSPVRMGRVERKRLEKQRRWRKGLLCCKS